jgi:hypothetical protein
MMNMEGRNKVLFIFLLLFSILILLSQNFWTQGENVSEFLDWMEYESISGWVYVSWQDSFFSFLSPLTYLPMMAGVVGIAGALGLLGSVRASKLLNLVAFILALLAYGLFILFHALFGLIVGSAMLIPNLPGAYLCLVSGILLLICSYSLKSSKVEGHAMENKQYYAIGGETPTPSPTTAKAPTIKCPKCGALIPGDQLFCENCGQYL